MKKSHFFHFYPADFLSSPTIRRLSAKELGIFLVLLAMDWEGDGLPADDLDALAMMPRDVEAACLPRVLALFAESHPETGRRTHQKLNRERERMEEYSARQSANGKRGGRPPKTIPHGSGEKNPLESQKNPPLSTENPQLSEKNPPLTHRFQNKSDGFQNETHRLAKKSQPSQAKPSQANDKFSDENSPPVAGEGQVLPGCDLFDENHEVATHPLADGQKPDSANAGRQEIAMAKKSEPCPHAEIAKLWNEVMASTPIGKVVSISPAREISLRGLWAFWAGGRAEKLDATRHLFERVARSEFCRGESTGFVADFDWVIKPANRLKILEGKYDNRPSHSHSPSNSRR